MIATKRKRKPDTGQSTRARLLVAAARRVSRDGYAATSMRDIATDVGMLAGSIYHHFPSKEDLVAEAYARGVDTVIAAHVAAVDGVDEPWARLEATAAAHLDALLADAPLAALLTLDLARLPADLRARLVAERDRYERRFAAVVRALDLPAGTDRRLVRLMLLGALNFTPTWYRPGGASPRRIAEAFVATLRAGLSDRAPRSAGRRGQSFLMRPARNAASRA